MVNHLNIQPVYDIYANVQDRDLGGISSDINAIVESYKGRLAPGNDILVHGIISSMKVAFTKLGWGFILAIMLVYFVMVINFQSWMDPFVITMAIPGAIAGIVWMLFLTGTTFNIPSLMGSIMSVGVVTANSILLVTFANFQLKEGRNNFEAAYTAGLIRLRPILMTALAMIVGMIPMAMEWEREGSKITSKGEGGDWGPYRRYFYRCGARHRDSGAARWQPGRGLGPRVVRPPTCHADCRPSWSRAR